MSDGCQAQYRHLLSYYFAVWQASRATCDKHKISTLPQLFLVWYTRAPLIIILIKISFFIAHRVSPAFSEWVSAHIRHVASSACYAMRPFLVSLILDSIISSVDMLLDILSLFRQHVCCQNAVNKMAKTTGYTWLEAEILNTLINYINSKFLL